MPASTPTNTPIPANTTEGTQTLNNQDTTSGTRVPQIMPTSANSSLPIEPAYAPIYPRPTVYHRASSLTSTTGITAADTADNAHDPTVVPTWIGKVVTANSASNTFTVVPYGNYGAPPAAPTNYYLDPTGANAETLSISAQSGGSGAAYTLTIAASGTLAHTHPAGSYIIAMTSGGISTNNASSIPSGPLGGPGSNWIDFRCFLTAGTATTNATVMPRQWDDLSSKWVDTASTALQAASGATQYQLIRVETHGFWYYCQVPTLSAATGTPALLITAVVS